MIVLIDKDNNISKEVIMDWKEHTNKSCNIYFFEGGDFFINERGGEVVK